MYKWESKGKDLVVHNIDNFDPVHIFECGQCFRWDKLENGHWFGVANGLALELTLEDNDLVLYNTTEKEFVNYWYSYFDLGRDYGEIKAKLSSNDPVMEKAIGFGHGIRLLKQDFNEMLISFLISQNNGIPRIKKIIRSLCSNFGEPIEFSDRVCYSFPSLKRLKDLTLEDLGIIRAGYRDKYILRVSRQVTDNLIDMNVISKGDIQSARKEMLKLFGVGEKVADCILLFSGTRYDIFPVDRWVKRVMAELYLGYEASNKEIYDFAIERFGDLAGFAQQYLFYYAREHKIGMQEKALS